jgi:DNA modification methylase
MGSLYRSKHELVAVYKVGSRPHINNIALGKHGRNRTNVWDYAGITSIGEERSKELAMHPTVKPVELVRDAVLDCSKRGGLILDVFSGSGTSLLAAELAGRIGYGMEIDPGYVDTAVMRLKAKTGLEARLGAHGPTFDEVKRERRDDFGEAVA